MFQSPLGEVVKETIKAEIAANQSAKKLFQSPLGEVVKETMLRSLGILLAKGFNPLSGKW